jgi:hypothetical protein
MTETLMRPTAIMTMTMGLAICAGAVIARDTERPEAETFPGGTARDVRSFSDAAIPCEREAAERVGQPAFERPIHYGLIRNQGIMIGELSELDGLAAAWRRTGCTSSCSLPSP